MNKEQLEKMSDGDLSVAVTISMLKSRFKEAKSIEFDGTQHCIWVNNCGFSSYVVMDINNWSDMGPLIKSYGIIVDGNGSAMVVIGNEYEHLINNDNCLRAAAIVYLLMQEDK